MISIDGLQSLAEILRALDIEMHQRFALSAAAEALETTLRQAAKRHGNSQQGRDILDSIEHSIIGNRGIVGSTAATAVDLECGTSDVAPQPLFTLAAQTEADSIVQTTANALHLGLKS